MVAVLITELSFLVGARPFFLVEERGENGHFSTVFLWTWRRKKKFSSWFSRRGPICFRIRRFFSCKFNRYRERAFWKSSFYSLFLLTILALHLQCLRKSLTIFLSMLDFFKIHDTLENLFLRTLRFFQRRFESRTDRRLCVYKPTRDFLVIRADDRHFSGVNNSEISLPHYSPCESRLLGK